MIKEEFGRGWGIRDFFDVEVEVLEVVEFGFSFGFDDEGDGGGDYGFEGEGFEGGV